MLDFAYVYHKSHRNWLLDGSKVLKASLECVKTPNFEMISARRLLNTIRSTLLQPETCLVRNMLARQSQQSRNFIIDLKTGPVEMRFEDKMDYGIYALTPGYVREGAIEAVRLAITRAIKSKDLSLIKAETPVTKKPEGSRMGKGKGKVSYHVAKVAAGRLMFEFNCEDETLAKEAFRQANFKLPLRIYLRKKPREPRKVLSLSELDEIRRYDSSKL